MTDTFFDFVMNTTRENFTSSQREVSNHPNYNPYSDDLNLIEELLDKNEFAKASEYRSINTVLSARAHLYKNYAYDKMNKTQEAQSELMLAQKIMEGISLTGDGTKKNPYIVSRVSDERDMLLYFQEEFMSQALIKDENKVYDLVKCQSGKELYFDITTPYSKLQKLMHSDTFESPIQKMMDEQEVPKKKWWEFWK